MKRVVFSFLFFVLATLVLTNYAVCQDAPVAQEAPAAPEIAAEPIVETQTISGIVILADENANLLIVKEAQDPTTEASKEIAVTVMPSTSIVKGDQIAKFSDIAVDSQVTVEFQMNKDGVAEAISIQVK